VGDRGRDTRTARPRRSRTGLQHGQRAAAFPSPEFFADFFLDYYGPTLKASEALTAEGRSAFRDDLIALATAANRATDGTLVSDWEFLVTVATKA
jgi:hypothetical protein